MNLLKKMFYSYLIGVLISSSLILLIIIFDYFLNGFFDYPELLNLVAVCILSGLGFGLTHFAISIFDESKKKKQ